MDQRFSRIIFCLHHSFLRCFGGYICDKEFYLSIIIPALLVTSSKGCNALFVLFLFEILFLFLQRRKCLLNLFPERNVFEQNAQVDTIWLYSEPSLTDFWYCLCISPSRTVSSSSEILKISSLLLQMWEVVVIDSFG